MEATRRRSANRDRVGVALDSIATKPPILWRIAFAFAFLMKDSEILENWINESARRRIGRDVIA